MEVEVGKVLHYYDKVNLAVLKLDSCLKLGDIIHIRGSSTNVVERLISMEVDNHRIIRSLPGANVLIDVVQPVEEHDLVMWVREGDRDLTSA